MLSRPISEDFTPKFITTLREGYNGVRFRRDLVAGLTVAIVALPLSMAIAIASHASPERGLFTAIVGGFLISFLGGSRFQIGGPAGAFIVLMASIVDRFGFDGILIVTLSAGLLLTLIGLLKLGTYIKYVPHPVTVGFSAGIAIIIASSQVKDFLGLKLTGNEPGEIIPKFETLYAALPTINPSAALLALGSVVLIVALRKLRPNWPGFLIAVTCAALAAWLFNLQVETISTRFGMLPRSLPSPTLPDITVEKIRLLMPDILAVTLLGGIESLLSAVVADSMSGRRHRPNMELVAQGIANMACSLFGGITATGTIARTATNVRSGATSPVAGMLHALFIMLFILVAAPLAGYVPLAALSAILMVVAWNMAERHEFIRLVKVSKTDAAVLLATFLLVVFVDLSTGIVVGVVMGCLLFMHRMSQSIAIETHQHAEEEREYVTVPGVIIHRISGAFFFGAASGVAMVLNRMNTKARAYVLDFTNVPFVDSTAAHELHSFVTKASQQSVPVYLTGATLHVRRELIANGIKKPLVHYGTSVEASLHAIANGHEIDHDGT